MRYWLFKSEPGTYSIDDLARDGRTHWDGVRNYQARNYLRDEIQVGDLVLFYHSSAEPPGVAGLARVVRAGYPDHTAQDPESKYYDPRATPEDPRWYMVDIEFVERFPRFVPLAELAATEALRDMPLVRRARPSIQPVTPEQFRTILAIAGSGRTP